MGWTRGWSRLAGASLVALGLGCAGVESPAARPASDPVAAADAPPQAVRRAQPRPPPRFLTSRRLEVRPSADHAPARRVDVEAQDEPLARVVARLARDASVTFAVDPALDERVTLSLRDVPPREALEVLARLTRARIADLPGDGALLVPTDTVTASFSDHEVHGALETIGRLVGATVVVADDVRGRVTVDLHDVPWRDAVAHVARAVGAEVTHERGCTLVGRPPTSSLTWRSALPSEAVQALRAHVRLDLVAEEAVAPEVADALGRLAGCHVLVHPDADVRRVDLALTDAPFGLALDLLARALGAEVEARGPDVFVLWARPRGVLRASGAPAATLLPALAAYAGRDVALGPGVDDLVSFDLRGLHAAETLRVVAWKHGWQVEERAEGALVITTPSPRPERPLPMTPLEVEVDKLVQDIQRLARERRVGDLEAHLRALRDLAAGQAVAPPRPSSTPPPDPEERTDLLERLLLQTLEEADPALVPAALRRISIRGATPAAGALRDLIERLARRLEPPPVDESLPASTLLEAAQLALEAMTAALDANDLAAARRSWSHLQRSFWRVRGLTDHQAIVLPAESAFVRGLDLLREVERLEDLERRFGPLLRVTAVILPGDRDQPPSAIVGGRLLVAGDGVVDPATDEVIAGLVVSEVTADGVRLRFEGRPFTCPLGGGPPRR
ncbi:MAG: hypothetical protein KF878_34620 [Planctomycetes bacterium]|nr:hypothetical protein [Planctomycetota bacterium]